MVKNSYKLFCVKKARLEYSESVLENKDDLSKVPRINKYLGSVFRRHRSKPIRVAEINAWKQK